MSGKSTFKEEDHEVQAAIDQLTDDVYSSGSLSFISSIVAQVVGVVGSSFHVLILRANPEFDPAENKR
jgi:hypothetical protein